MTAVESPSSGVAKGTVRFAFKDPLAREVLVVGSFNHWQPVPLQKVDQRWALELQLPAGHYEYQFLVDGQWVPDPAASHSVLNPFGGRNSVLCVAPNE